MPHSKEIVDRVDRDLSKLKFRPFEERDVDVAKVDGALSNVGITRFSPGCSFGQLARLYFTTAEISEVTT